MNIVFLDCTQNYGYHFSAGNTKVDFLVRGLNQNDNRCTIINGVMGYSQLRSPNSRYIEGVGEVITYPAAKLFGLSFYKNSCLLKKDLDRLKKGCDENILVLTAPHLHLYYLYIALGRSLGYKIVTISHEWLTTIKKRFWFQRLESYLYAKTFGYLVDGILPISHFISDRIARFNKPMLLTPILARFELFDKKIEKEKIFTYCVYAAYYRVITMIVDAYAKYSANNPEAFQLFFVLSGTDAQIDKVKQYIKNRGCADMIHIKEKLPYDELFSLYCSSQALIIPLDPHCQQDHARFSQKIAEYLSSATPIISNNVGEIPFYFQDKKNIILCDYNTGSFVEAIQWVTDNPVLAEKIGQEGFNLGKRAFNYQLFGEKFHNFLKTLFQ